MPSNWLEEIYEESKQELFRFLYVLLGDKQSAEDEGLIIYGKTESFESGDDINWRWIDEKTRVCWCVYVPLDEGLDSVDIVKEIIDLNK